MLREFIHASSGTSADIEAITAERDFFREKYAEQMNELEDFKVQLKESQRVIAKLRGQILDLEMEKAGLAEQAAAGRALSKAPKQIESGGGSANTSVTGLSSSDDDLTTKSSGENNADPVDEAADSSLAGGVTVTGAPTIAQTPDEQGCVQEAESCEDDDQSDPDEESGEEEDDEDDEVEDIRANAARMLLWANYQTSKPRTPNTSLIQEDADNDNDEESKADSERPLFDTPSRMALSPNAIVYSLPASLDKRQLNLDDDSTLDSGSRHHLERSVGSWRSNTAKNERAGNGKIGKLFNNLRDMIDPPSESDSESDMASSVGSFN